MMKGLALTIFTLVGIQSLAGAIVYTNNKLVGPTPDRAGIPAKSAVDWVDGELTNNAEDTVE